MTAEEKLSFFYELINCNYELYHWEYDHEFKLLYTNWTKRLFSHGFLVYTGLEKVIRNHLAQGKRLPVILEIEGNVLWICCFQPRDGSLCHTYLVGPIFSGLDSLMVVRRRLDSYEISVKTRSAIFKNFESIPAISPNLLSQYAVMLHYCLNGDKISSNAVTYLSNNDGRPAGIYQPDEHNRAGIWYTEQQFCRLISEGNPLYKDALEKFFSISSGMDADFGDSLRNHKNNALVLLTLCSRACIHGGLSPMIAYDLNDFYAARIEECDSMAAAKSVCENMLEDFAARVRESQKQSQVSGPIRDSCYYIKTHTDCQLSLKELAKRAGYTEYYFSQKFKKEVGCSVSDFILNEKIELAKLLLADTGESVQSISDRLSFGSRSYFYTCFQKLTGLSPSEYRKRNGKL